MAQRFPKEVHDFIAENVAGRTTRELVSLVNARFGKLFTESSMKAYKNNHGLKSGMPIGKLPGTPTKLFPQAVMEYIKENYKGVGHKEMAERVNERFGTSYTVQQIGSFYGNRKLNSGLTGRFPKGHTPFNKGWKGVCAPGCEKTQFRKGNLPHNTKPIGYERINGDGYVEVKVKMRPSSPQCNDNFQAKHRLIWEQLHGPVPPGCRVIFKDGNRQNFDPANLALITTKEGMEMCRRSLFTDDAELTEAGIMVARVRVAARKRERREKSD